MVGKFAIIIFTTINQYFNYSKAKLWPIVRKQPPP